MSASANEGDASLYFEEYAPPWRPLLVLVLPLLPVFWTYRVDVAETTLAFGYSYAHFECDRADVASAEAVERVDGLTQWGGWGIRYNFRGETGYVAKNGPAVRVGVRRERGGGNDVRSYYVFSCDRPAEVCRILNGREGESSHT